MGGIDLPPTTAGKFSRLVDLSVACRYLAAQCSVCDTSMLCPCFALKNAIQVRLGKWDDALEMLGEVNPFRGKANEPRRCCSFCIRLSAHSILYSAPFVIPEQQGGVKVASTS